MGELTDFILDARPLLEVLGYNQFADLDAPLAFFGGYSRFYPDFDRLLRERIIAA